MLVAHQRGPFRSSCVIINVDILCPPARPGALSCIGAMLPEIDRNSDPGLSGDLKDAIARGDTAYLMKALEDASLQVRVAAVEGLGTLGGEQARLALSRIARDRWEQRPDMRIAALRTLKKVTEPARYANLLEDFITDDNRRVTTAARHMLRDVDPEGFPYRLLEKRAVDHGAIRVYGTSRLKEAVPLLASFLEQSMESGDITSIRKWGKVFAAVKALGNTGGRPAVETIESLLFWIDARETVSGQHFADQRLEKIREAAVRALQTAREAGGPDTGNAPAR